LKNCHQTFFEDISDLSKEDIRVSLFGLKLLRIRLVEERRFLKTTILYSNTIINTSFFFLVQ